MRTPLAFMSCFCHARQLKDEAERSTTPRKSAEDARCERSWSWLFFSAGRWGQLLKDGNGDVGKHDRTVKT